MKILLVRPPVPSFTIGLKHVMICEPLELEYLGAALDGHDVEMIDLIVESGFEKRLRQFQPDIVALSCYITGVNEVIKLTRKVKQWQRSCLTVVGGIHASVAPEDFADPSIDCIALAEGCTAIRRIVNARIDGGSLAVVPNLAIPSGPRQVVRTPAEPYMESPDSLPLPRRDLTSHLRHRYYYLFHQPVAIMKTTWGCWYDCKFCMTWRATGGVAHSRSPESIMRELESISEDEVYIVDDIFLINPARLSRIAHLIREHQIRKHYLVYGRADFIAANEPIIKEWAAIGLTAVIIGLEANSPLELASLGKTTTADQNRHAVEILRRHGVDTYASLIPQPWYERADWERLFSFIEETGLYYVNISPLTPLPGSPNFKNLEAHVTVPRQAHPLWDLTHCLLPTRLPLRQYYRELLRLYARTVLSMRRAAALTLRTRPSVWSRQYLRLWWGAVHIFFQFIAAHRHHAGRSLRRALDRGEAVAGLDYPVAIKPSQETFRPLDPYNHYFESQPRNSNGSRLLAVPAARRWRDVVSRGISEGLYTYQQPLDGKSGPLCDIEGKTCRMISSYDYLGLLGHPTIEAAACEAVRRYGTGTGGVRLLTGTTTLHRQLDSAIARFKGVEACVTFSSGYVANLAVITALFRPSDRVILDSRVHRSICDACRMASLQAEQFNHNDIDHLESLLQKPNTKRRTLVVVEGVYSMDGDICRLPDLVELRSRFGFFLMVDEAHSFGTLGASGRGVDEHFGIESGQVDIWMGSLSKGIPSCGGFIAGSSELITYLHHGAAPYMFSAAAAPAAAAAALAALEVLEAEPDRLVRLTENAEFLRSELIDAGCDIGLSSSHVIPVILGSDDTTYRTSHALFCRGLVALGIVPPAVAYGSARLRLCATAAQDKRFLRSAVADIRTVCADIDLAPAGKRRSICNPR